MITVRELIVKLKRFDLNKEVIFKRSKGEAGKEHKCRCGSIISALPDGKKVDINNYNKDVVIIKVK